MEKLSNTLFILLSSLTLFGCDDSSKKLNPKAYGLTVKANPQLESCKKDKEEAEKATKGVVSLIGEYRELIKELGFTPKPFTAFDEKLKELQMLWAQQNVAMKKIDFDSESEEKQLALCDSFTQRINTAKAPTMYLENSLIPNLKKLVEAKNGLMAGEKCEKGNPCEEDVNNSIDKLATESDGKKIESVTTAPR